ncbi:hypothetical protein U1Q18_027191 [Sarracenia purpurea var. burkii]
MLNRSPETITLDWDTMVLHKSKPKAQDLPNPKSVEHALQSGGQIQTMMKLDASVNTKSVVTIVNVRNLDEAIEPVVLEWVSLRVTGPCRLLLLCHGEQGDLR